MSEEINKELVEKFNNEKIKKPKKVNFKFVRKKYRNNNIEITKKQKEHMQEIKEMFRYIRTFNKNNINYLERFFFQLFCMIDFRKDKNKKYIKLNRERFSSDSK